MFEAALDVAELTSGKLLLDIGCGAGGALVIARRRGAEVAGLDASANLATIARKRLPGARIEVGETEHLQFADETFDIVISTNSFPFASDLVNALSEAKRVLRRNGTLMMLVWGRREDCELVSGTASAVFPLLPPGEPGTPPPLPLAEPNAIDEVMHQAGLEPTDASEFSAALAVPDAQTAVRVVLSASARPPDFSLA
ncbi:class I SAM-dependent methyltransferase [Mesorhizobium sp. M0145]|uniref:class I SAM-dependent methyltransferase n=1 Tax=Mesorhizobium sp. M0145 TaxID=2956895 RepID=UPI00333920BB